MKETEEFESNKREILYSQIIEALETMPDRLREVFVLKHYEGMSEQAIATRTGIRPQELAAIVWKANSTFQQSLRKVG